MELSKKSRVHYSKEFKLSVVEEYLDGARLCDLMRKYSISGYAVEVERKRAGIREGP